MFNTVSNWVQSVAKEIRGITWPPRKRVINDTSIVVIALVLGGIVIAIIDFSFSELFKMAISKIGQI